MYSYSKLSCYIKCPYKFKLKYVDRIKVDFEEPIELFLGKRVHETLRILYQNVKQKRRILLDELIEYLYSQWHGKWHNNIRFVRNRYDQKDYIEFAEGYISNYYYNYKPFNYGRTIALEKRIVSTVGHNYRFCCYIDRISKNENGIYEIHDYKTTSRIPSKEYFQNDLQLLLYALLLRKRFPYIKKIKLVWHYLKFNKEFFAYVDLEHLKHLESEIEEQIKTIEETNYFPVTIIRWKHIFHNRYKK